MCYSCSYHDSLSNQAVNFNKGLEQSENKVLLLNIIRAKEENPRYFSTVTNSTSRFSGTFSPSLGISIPTPFDSDTENIRLDPRLNASINTGFNSASIVNLNTRQFKLGLQSIVNLDIVEYFINQGISIEFLLSIFTRKIEIKDGIKVRNLYNRPDVGFEEVNNFIEFVKIIRRMEIELQTNDIVLGVPIKKESLSNDKLLNLMKKTKENKLNLKYDENTEEYKFIRKKVTKNLKIFANKKLLQEYFSELEYSPGFDENLEIELKGSLLDDKLEVSPKGSNGDGSIEPSIVFYLRSPEGIISYLGEIVRYQKNSGIEMKPLSWRGKEVFLLIVDESDKRSKDSYVTVKYQDRWYSVNNNKEYKSISSDIFYGHKTNRVFSIIQQIIDLNTSRDDLKVSNVITTVPAL